MNATSYTDPSSPRTATIERWGRRVENGKSQRTAEIYTWALTRLDMWLTARSDARLLEALTCDDIDDFLGDFRYGRAPFDREHKQSYVSQIYRSLAAFYDWHSDRLEYPNPMTKVEARLPGEQPIDGKVLRPEQLAAIVATVKGKRDFTSTRDHAMIRMLLNMLRREELAALRVDDLDLRNREVTVKGKGDKSGARYRTISFGASTAEALDDYLELRERHPFAEVPQLWVGRRGVVQGRGILYIIRKRGLQAGIEGVHPHQFRHTYADQFLANGGSEGDLMQIGGWKTAEMPRYYAKETAAKRGRAAARKFALDDRY